MPRPRLLALLLPAVLAACGGAARHTPARTPVEHLTPYGPPTRPFSPAVRVGDLLFLSGQIGVLPSATGQLAPGGIEAETRQTMLNIRDVL